MGVPARSAAIGSAAPRKNVNGETSIRPCRIGTSSGTLVSAWASSRPTGSRSGAGSNTVCASSGTFARIALPSARRSTRLNGFSLTRRLRSFACSRYRVGPARGAPHALRRPLCEVDREVVAVQGPRSGRVRRRCVARGRVRGGGREVAMHRFGVREGRCRSKVVRRPCPSVPVSQDTLVAVRVPSWSGPGVAASVRLGVRIRSRAVELTGDGPEEPPGQTANLVLAPHTARRHQRPDRQH